MNVGKLSLSLNLGCPEGRAVLDDLVAWTDVLIESFSPRGPPRARPRLRPAGGDQPRLGHAVELPVRPGRPAGGVRRVRQHGGRAHRLLRAHRLARSGARRAVQRLHRLRVAAVLDRCRAAARWRSGASTGAGSTSTSPRPRRRSTSSRRPCSTPRSTDATAQRHGNDDAVMAPHGIYPCAGDDRWVAVACRDDADWRALADVLGSTGPRRPRRRRPPSSSARARRASSARGPRRSTPAAAEAVLIGRGIPAHGVQHSPECAADPQLRHLGHLVPSSTRTTARSRSRARASTSTRRRAVCSAARRSSASTTPRCWRRCSATTTSGSARSTPSARSTDGGPVAPPASPRSPVSSGR